MKATGYAMNSDKSIKKPPLTRFGGRPPKLTFEAKTVLLDSLRNGRSYAGACLAAGITPVTLFNHRRVNSRFDAQCRAARTTGKKLPLAMPGQATTIDSYGNIVPNSEIIADEKERARLQRLREHLHGLTRGEASPKRLSHRRENCHDAVVKRLLELRENYEADLRKSEAGNRTMSSSPLPSHKENSDWSNKSHNKQQAPSDAPQIAPLELPEAPPECPKPLPRPKPPEIACGRSSDGFVHTRSPSPETLRARRDENFGTL
jgi:hypothetical protein